MKTTHLYTSQNGLEETHQLRNGRTITLKSNEEWTEISFWENNNKIEGKCFQFYDDNEDQSVFHLRWMYSPSDLKRCGLGELVIRFHKQLTSGATIYTTEPHLTHNDVNDGSQLTEDAKVFVRAMQKLKLIAPWQSDYDIYDNYNE